MRCTDFRTRLGRQAPILLDGPMGTELSRRGVDTGLPLWSAWGLIEAPEQVEAIHREYVAAGAEVVTTNTFRTHRRSLAEGGQGERAEELTRLATELARGALRDAAGWVAGSVSPLEDCYSPELTPADAELAREHEAMCGWLADAGVDVMLVETMPTIREAEAAARAALATGLPVIVTLVCDGGGQLLSGEAPEDAARRLEALGVDALGINCTPSADLGRALARLRSATGLPLAAYGNVGYADAAQGWTPTDALDPQAYAALAEGWLALGARLVGSCCGTTPEHTRALGALLARRQG